MTPLERLYLNALLAAFSTALFCGFFFGMWQDNWYAGAFMFGFTMIMQEKK